MRSLLVFSLLTQSWCLVPCAPTQKPRAEVDAGGAASSVDTGSPMPRSVQVHSDPVGTAATPIGEFAFPSNDDLDLANDPWWYIDLDSARFRAGAWLEEGFWHASSRGPLPQPKDLFSLFSSARPSRHETYGGMIVCQANVSNTHGWDSFKAPDLSAAMRLGALPVTEVRGGEDTHMMMFSSPVRTLARNDTIWMKLVDRDVWEDETIASKSMRFEGTFPIEAEAGTLATLQCRALDQETIDARVRVAEQRADARIAAFENAAAPDLRAINSNYPHRLLAAAQLGWVALSAWLPRDEERLATRRARISAMHDRWVDSARRAVAGFSSDSEEAHLAPRLILRKKAFVCGSDVATLRGTYSAARHVGPGACLLVLEIQNDTDETFDLGANLPTPKNAEDFRREFDLFVIGDDGRYEEIASTARELDGRPISAETRARVAPGSRLTVSAVVAPRPILAFRLGDDASFQILRLARPHVAPK